MVATDYITKESALSCFHDWIDRYGHEHSADEMTEYQRIEELPAADVVEVVRCKNCKHRPVVVNPSRPYGFGLAGPGSDPFGRDETCPYLCDDGYYNRMPDDDWFCNFGEVKDG